MISRNSPVESATETDEPAQRQALTHSEKAPSGSMSWNQRIQQALHERQQQQLWRQRALLGDVQQTHTLRNGQPVLNFCANDYLGLAACGADDLAHAAQRWAMGSGASHLVCGHSSAHHELEQALAAHCGYERALLFSTGFMANLGTIAALAGRGDEVLQDKLNHASLLDGALLSRARLSRYRHADYHHLQQLLDVPANGERLIVSDSIFSMDGDLADVRRLSELSSEHNALLMIDDAHGFGVLGSTLNTEPAAGQGVRAYFGLSPQQLPLYVGTLGKALGGFGAFVAGSADLIDYLIQFARPYIYTTALPPALAEAMLANLKRLQQGDRQQQLQANIRYFRRQAASLGLSLMPSESAIQPLLIGDSGSALRLSEQLLQRRLWVSAIRPPTVPAGSARLRITLSAAHRQSDIDLLLNALAELLPVQEASA